MYPVLVRLARRAVPGAAPGPDPDEVLLRAWDRALSTRRQIEHLVVRRRDLPFDGEHDLTLELTVFVTAIDGPGAAITAREFANELVDERGPLCGWSVLDDDPFGH